MTVHFATVQVDGKTVAASCTSFSDTEPFPPVCGGIITLKAPAK